MSAPDSNQNDVQLKNMLQKMEAANQVIEKHSSVRSNSADHLHFKKKNPSLEQQNSSRHCDSKENSSYIEISGSSNKLKSSSGNSLSTMIEGLFVNKLETTTDATNKTSGSDNSIYANPTPPSHESIDEVAAVASSREYEEQWAIISNTWDKDRKKNLSMAKKLVLQSGIPNILRGIIWPILVDRSSKRLKSWYAQTINRSSPHDNQIRRDLDRTFPNHHLFNEADGVGQENLFKVIKAYSLYDPEMGYCQGVAFIVGILLMQLPEEDCFFVLVCLMEDYNMRGLFLPEMPMLSLAHFQLNHLLHENCPLLKAHFERQSLYMSSFATQWLLTIFSTALPFPIVYHIIDYMLVYGQTYNRKKVHSDRVGGGKHNISERVGSGLGSRFMNNVTGNGQDNVYSEMGAIKVYLKFIIVILKDLETRLLSCSMEEMIHVLKNEINCHFTCDNTSTNGINDKEILDANAISKRLVNLAHSFYISEKRLKQLKTVHDQEKSKHQEKSSFVNKLTKSNLDLKQKIVILEREKQSLKDSLQKVTVQLGDKIQENMNQINALDRENALLKAQLKRYKRRNSQDKV